MFVAINVANDTRLAVTAAGSTVAVWADSNAVAAARAWLAAASACPAAALNHPTYGAAAATIDNDAGPDHGPLANPETTDRNDEAAADKSDANPSQADAAISNGPGPAPPKINAELISGGKSAKSATITTSTQPAAPATPTPTQPALHAPQQDAPTLLRILGQIHTKYPGFHENLVAQSNDIGPHAITYRG